MPSLLEIKLHILKADSAFLWCLTHQNQTSVSQVILVKYGSPMILSDLDIVVLEDQCMLCMESCIVPSQKMFYTEIDGKWTFIML